MNFGCFARCCTHQKDTNRVTSYATKSVFSSVRRSFKPRREVRVVLKRPLLTSDKARCNTSSPITMKTQQEHHRHVGSKDLPSKVTPPLCANREGYNICHSTEQQHPLTSRAQCPDSKPQSSSIIFFLNFQPKSQRPCFFQTLFYSPHHEDVFSISGLALCSSVLLLLLHVFHRSLESQSILEFPPILPPTIGVEF